MKRVLVAAMMLLVTGSVFATDVNVDREKGKQEVKASEVKKEVNVKDVKFISDDESCTIKAEGWIGVPFFGIHVECQATASTCEKAIKMVVNCVRKTIAAIEEEVQKFEE